ncbi:unnamed protein product [Cuscuta epithymum]|uniref:F-box domain-containing protein n=1 Tax=Cuscuta epithymum TaxID=186058 RepID=A0AAV0CME3_9ASTE|nr:unnamed protein product [Cuscuta epithymum]
MARKKIKTRGNDKNVAEASHQILHDDIISHILKRLPARVLMQFKCVCKDWTRLIRDPDFAESHLSHSRAQPTASYVLCMTNTGAFAADQSLVLKNSWVPANPDLFRTHMPCSNSVNGLICFGSRGRRPGSRNSHNIVYNLSTGEKRDLPQPPIPGIFSTYALGFDPAKKKYKVLHFGPIGGGRIYGQIRGCQIFTLERNSSWRSLSHVPNSPYPLIRLNSIYLDGKIYYYDQIHIRFFDLTSEKFGTIETPPYFSPFYNTPPRLIEAGSNLAVVSWRNAVPHPECSFWVLDQNWSLRCTFSMKFEKIWGSVGRSVLLLGREDLFLFDANARTRKKLKKARDEYTHVLCNHVENIYPLSTTQ